jgi:hypothetical protein
LLINRYLLSTILSFPLLLANYKCFSGSLLLATLKTGNETRREVWDDGLSIFSDHDDSLPEASLVSRESVLW